MAPGAKPGLNAPPLPKWTPNFTNVDEHPFETSTFGSATGGLGIAAGGQFQHNTFPTNNEESTRPTVYTGAMGPGGNAIGRIPPVTAPAGRKPVLPHADTIPPDGNWDALNRSAGNHTATEHYLGRNDIAEENLQKFLKTLPAADVDRFIGGMYSPSAEQSATTANSVGPMLDAGGGRPAIDPADPGTQESAWRLYRRMLPNALVPMTSTEAQGGLPGGDSGRSLSGSVTSTMEAGRGDYRQPTKRVFVDQGAKIPAMTALHEASHYGQGGATTFSESKVPSAISNAPTLASIGLPDRSREELAPTLQHFPAIAELARTRRAELALPNAPHVDVRFANGSGMDLEAMRRAAQTHGLLDGQKSIQSLLNTQAGQAWLKQKILPQQPTR